VSIYYFVLFFLLRLPIWRLR